MLLTAIFIPPMTHTTGVKCYWKPTVEGREKVERQWSKYNRLLMAVPEVGTSSIEYGMWASALLPKIFEDERSMRCSMVFSTGYSALSTSLNRPLSKICSTLHVHSPSTNRAINFRTADDRIIDRSMIINNWFRKPTDGMQSAKLETRICHGLPTANHKGNCCRTCEYNSIGG